MTKTVYFTLLLFTLIVPVFGQGPLLTLVNAEKKFAQFSKDSTTKAAFLANLAPDGVTFVKGKVTNGRESLEKSPASPGKLTWQPVAADVSAAGDLGYTTGPWEWRPKSLADKPTGYGHYVSLWKKQADNSWKVALDIGISHPAPAAPPVNTIRAATGIRSVTSADTTQNREELLAFDKQFANTLEKSGAATTYKQHLAPQARLYRMNQQPYIEQTAIDQLLRQPVTLAFFPLNAAVAESGDLGYVYGNSQVVTTTGGKPVKQAGNYLRIWKKDSQNQWRIVVDLIALEPVEQTEK
ncbi:ketosteroid isomerase-like protein [Larkinella arboricola]|uniref:Ketosteroid isomerase-like protein n=1 Tax=Larkinella arboricola TaxID=643671 RepID=A0A327WM17_LARAB|nr:nuclear transport factor 2 family protein [Larkinella arboricola]RAJ92174.1 ketosteroid isomerase-like protein [Larkinella arboricola]